MASPAELQSSNHSCLSEFMEQHMDICCVRKKDDYLTLIDSHVLNHVKRTRKLVIKNNQRLQQAKEQNQLTDELIEQCRDQGLSRPTVLLICPFRKFAHRLVCTLRAQMFAPEKRPFVQNWTRFDSEFGNEDGNRVHEKRQVSDDYRELMTGNVDDCFTLGIGLAKKCLKLFTQLDESDILLCSPLGLKMIIGGKEEDDKNENNSTKSKMRNVEGNNREQTGSNDFLASIEVLVIERADVLLMQNWEHLMDVLGALNCIPKQIRSDINRIRPWSLEEGGAQQHRQTLLFSHINFVEMHAIFAQYCANLAGMRTLIQQHPIDLLPVKQISVPCVQKFFRFDGVESPEQQADYRFEYFVKHLLPKCPTGTLVFISSYFDFIRLRNHLKRQTESFVQLYEYADAGKVAQARQLFVRGEKRLMLMTERFHFFFRYRIKGIRSLIFYQPPVNPDFYPELVEIASTLTNKQQQKSFDAEHEEGEDHWTDHRRRLDSSLLFCRFDVLRLENIFGATATKCLLSSTAKTDSDENQQKRNELPVQTLVAN